MEQIGAEIHAHTPARALDDAIGFFDFHRALVGLAA
jgi:hypothetical protein